MAHFIYAAANHYMPSVVKIGRTTSPKRRIKELDSTSVPGQFKFLHCWRVKDGNDVEKKMHNLFSRFRVDQNREFFKVGCLDRLVLEMRQYEIGKPKKIIRIPRSSNQVVRPKVIGFIQ